MTWANPDTPRGQIEKLIEPIISGGASDADINKVVGAIFQWHAAQSNPYMEFIYKLGEIAHDQVEKTLAAYKASSGALSDEDYAMSVGHNILKELVK